MRGTLTEIQKNIIKNFMDTNFGEQILPEVKDEILTITSIRLIPYIDYVITNGGILELSKINRDEMEIIDMFENNGLLRFIDDDKCDDVNCSHIKVTNKFYQLMQIIKWFAYVNDNQEDVEYA